MAMATTAGPAGAQVGVGRFTRLRGVHASTRIPRAAKAGRWLTLIGTAVVLVMLVVAALAEWTLAPVTFVGGMLLLFGATLWLTPNIAPDRGAPRGSRLGGAARMSPRQLAMWGVGLAVAALGGLFLVLWFDWIARGIH